MKINFTKEQEKYVCDNYYNKTSSKLAKELNCTKSKITNTWYKNNLKGKQKRIYSLNESYFDIIDSEDKAYFLGFIASDGCIYKSETINKSNIVKITIHKKDIDVLEKFKTYIQTEKPINYFNGKYVTLELVSNKLVSSLNNLNLNTCKTYGNTIPNIDNKFMKDFIRGYFDGDGSISFRNNFFDVAVGISGYENNLTKIINYLESRNIFSSFLIDNRKYTTTNTGNFGQLVFSNKTNKYSFLKLIYGDASVYMNRKKSLSDNFISRIELDGRVSHKEIIIYYNYAVCKEN